MDTRRAFIKKAAMLGGGVGLWSSLPASIKKAFEIDPPPGSTFYDAEHVVFLMQENRSFDHLFGTLQGVRGYNDPRAIDLPNRNKVWLQSDDQGNTYPPFRLDIKHTKSTWTGNLPHSWTNQTDARNNGGFDRWLEAKRSGYEKYAHMPLTMGHYMREDLPFYYALADAFTVCDQHFCSSLTGTTPNRLFFFTGKLRGGKNNQANVDNSDVDYNQEADWETFPQRLEAAGVSWRVYQNEISLDSGLDGDSEFWLSNFTDNPLEWFKQHGVRFSKRHFIHCKQQVQKLPVQIKDLTQHLAELQGVARKKAERQIQKMKHQLAYAKEAIVKFSPASFDQLSSVEKNLHNKAFTVNSGDPDYHAIEEITYKSGTEQQQLVVPKGDVFYQFRKDVNSGQLPTVSWLVAPQAFSDHPSSPWYGAWYVSETMDILTSNPEVWKKTIFILTYDENDGYFDHIPPFVAPNPLDEKTGMVSKGLDATSEYVTIDQDIERIGKDHESSARESPVGLGYRVPMVIASPWSRGGWVNSQVFDHTSPLQFLESFLEKKTGKVIREENISSWRRAICGNLHSVFRTFNGGKVKLPYIDRNPFLNSILQAKNKQLPDGFHLMEEAEIKALNQSPATSPYMTRQEPGIRDACALPYELLANATIKKTGAHEIDVIQVSMTAGQAQFKEAAMGSPFTVYALGNEKDFESRNFSVSAGDTITASWPMSHWTGKDFLLRLYGPNGFFREWSGKKGSASLRTVTTYAQSDQKKLTGDLLINLSNLLGKPLDVQIKDNSYGQATKNIRLQSDEIKEIIWDVDKLHGWYDITIVVKGEDAMIEKLAGRIEDGKPKKTDPLMGAVV